MSIRDLFALLPMLLIAAFAVVTLLAISVKRHHGFSALLTLIGLVLSLLSAALLFVIQNSPRQVTPLLLIDRFGLFYSCLMIFATAVIASFSHGYLRGMAVIREEFYVLLLIACFGSLILCFSSHFASLFLGLEALTVSLYGMIGYLRERVRSVEAGVKYLILAAVSSAFALFGMALMYAVAGSLEFGAIVARLGQSPGPDTLFAVGAGMVVVGIGFKLAVVPFQLWTPDVYEGAPLPAAAFMATVSKGAVFAAAIRFAAALELLSLPGVLLILSTLAVASMFAGTLLALLQQNVKRVMAYSSIAHLGYLLVPLIASGTLALTASAVYLSAYFITALCAFGVMTIVSGPDRDADALDEYRGLAWRSPWLAAALAASLFSLAGLPLTAGFIGKFTLVAAGAEQARWALVLSLVVSSVIGLFFYLRIISVLFQTPGRSTPADQVVPLLGGSMLALLILALVWYGIVPGPLISLIEQAMRL